MRNATGKEEGDGVLKSAVRFLAERLVIEVMY